MYYTTARMSVSYIWFTLHVFTLARLKEAVITCRRGGVCRKI